MQPRCPEYSVRGMGGRATEGLDMADPRDREWRFSLRAGSLHLPLPPIPPSPAAMGGGRFINDSQDGFPRNRRLPLPSIPQRILTSIRIINIRKTKCSSRVPSHLPGLPSGLASSPPAAFSSQPQVARVTSRCSAPLRRPGRANSESSTFCRQGGRKRAREANRRAQEVSPQPAPAAHPQSHGGTEGPERERAE